ncbi:extracellular solute-binding protein [Paenibacillus sp. IB182496]|uniref:Extracellular solute-binding protein n=1 Tax=Paenibacillus sabuli TaxID=2772509 RepID=A0A927GU87_9BACL|nr:extracellular solute-binding protein [Paenibacillus sabuli]MBD2848101.1 extracellular solute-binding protein [Paenibacillus sabuli]
MRVWTKSRICFAAMMALVLVGMTACSGNQSGSEGEDGPIVITVGGLSDSTVEFKDGEDLEDNVYTRWLKEEKNIDLQYEFVVSKAEDYATKLRLALSSGSRLPDVIWPNTIELAHELIESGKVKAIGDDIEQYASPELKQLYEEHPEPFASLSRDGKVYGIPGYSSMTGGTVIWIRQDWLDHVGLEAPKTMDEMERVLDAFTHEDPDQNGKDDTFGLALALKNSYNDWMATADWIFGAYGDNLSGHWVEGEGGNLVYGGVQPSVKEALGTMNRWMEKGYIDPEAGIKDANKAGDAFVNEKAGVIAGPYWMGAFPLENLAANNPGANYVPLPLPAGPDGQIGRAWTNKMESMILFSSEFKHMDAYFDVLNEMSGFSFGDESSPFYKGFFNGYDYVEYDGKTYYKKEEIIEHVPEEQWPKSDGGFINVQKYFSLTGDLEHPYMFDEPLLKFSENPEAEPANPIESTVVKWGKYHWNAGAVRISQNEHTIVNAFTGLPTETMMTRSELMDKLESEAYSKIIYGEQPLDYFDTFVENWKKSGGEQMTQEVNAWYESTRP